MKLYCRLVIWVGMLTLLLWPASGTRADQQSRYLAVHHRDGGISVLVETGNSLRVAGSITIDGKDLVAGFVDGTFLYVVTEKLEGEGLQGRSPSLLRYDLTNPEKPKRDLALSIPQTWNKALYARDGSVFVGGKGLVNCDLTKPNPEVKVLINKSAFKEIDALAAAGDRLFAIDNIMMPLYVFVFDIADSLSPKLLGKYNLGEGFRPTVIGAAASPQHLLVLEYVHLFLKKEFRNHVLTLYGFQNLKLSDENFITEGARSDEMTSLSLINETAYVAWKNRGLVAVPIKEGKFQSSRLILEKVGPTYVTARGDRLYVLGADNNVLAVDVVDRKEPKVVSTVSLKRKAFSIW